VPAPKRTSHRAPLHGAPYSPTPGPWPYLWVIIATVIALALITTAV
jgi:hypothetical protein